MLTPEFLNLIEFNDVVKIYEQLNISITVDIINRVMQMNEITSTTREQLKVLKQTNGAEVFNETLQKTALLTSDTKKALKELYENVAKEDIQGYEELYVYKNKPFKLSESQYKILNQGLKQTNRLLRNFTNTIAFQSKQAYVETVDSAYMKIVSGAFDYNSAISTAVQELAEKGITLKDKAGRNVQLEVAVRRNVLSAVKETANNLNRNIEDDLGCDGYEVTAHIGARPTHAEAQGKQYAINHKSKESKKYPLWKKVKSLWKEYNCRHTYFGIILGVSKPVYSDKELKELKDATVTLNGKEVPYYEATQKQRQLENAIRKQKKTIQILENSNQNVNIQRGKLNQLQKQYTSFCKETGLAKDYSRIKVGTNKLTHNEQNSINKYISSDFYIINEKLRNNKELTTEESKLVFNLDTALNKLPKYEGLVRRSLELNEKDLQVFLNEYTINNTITYASYTSMTCGKRYNDNSNVELYVYSQNGKNMLKYNNDEQEILYKRNSKFKIKEIELKNNIYHILLEEING